MDRNSASANRSRLTSPKSIGQASQSNDMHSDRRPSQSEICDLDLLDLPPVGEVDHPRGMCYCYRCTCGRHICPGGWKGGATALSSTFRSLYKKDYRTPHTSASK